MDYEKVMGKAINRIMDEEHKSDLEAKARHDAKDLGGALNCYWKAEGLRQALLIILEECKAEEAKGGKQ